MSDVSTVDSVEGDSAMAVGSSTRVADSEVSSSDVATSADAVSDSPTRADTVGAGVVLGSSGCASAAASASAAFASAAAASAAFAAAALAAAAFAAAVLAAAVLAVVLAADAFAAAVFAAAAFAAAALAAVVLAAAVLGFVVVADGRFGLVVRAAVFFTAAARAADAVRAAAGSTLAAGVGSTTTSDVGAAFSAAALVGAGRAAVDFFAAGVFAAGVFDAVEDFAGLEDFAAVDFAGAALAPVVFAGAALAPVVFAGAAFVPAAFAAVVFGLVDFVAAVFAEVDFAEVDFAAVLFEAAVFAAADFGAEDFTPVAFFAPAEDEADLLVAGFREGAEASVGVSAPSAWGVGSSGEEVTVLRYQRVAESQGPTRQSAIRSPPLRVSQGVVVPVRCVCTRSRNGDGARLAPGFSGGIASMIPGTTKCLVGEPTVNTTSLGVFVTLQTVILAAGMGSRLGRALPKPLTELNDGRTIMGQQHDNIRAAFGSDARITTVVGYRAETIIEAFPSVNYVHNDRYDETNTSKSLLRALSATGKSGVLWMNGDVVFDPMILGRAAAYIERDQSFVTVNTAKVSDEEVKYTVTAEGFIKELSKSVKGGLGEAVGINYISSGFKKAFMRQLQRVEDQDYFERGLELAIAEDGLLLEPMDVSDLYAVEVDFAEDLERANLFV